LEVRICIVHIEHMLYFAADAVSFSIT